MGRSLQKLFWTLEQMLRQLHNYRYVGRPQLLHICLNYQHVRDITDRQYILPAETYDILVS